MQTPVLPPPKRALSTLSLPSPRSASMPAQIGPMAAGTVLMSAPVVALTFLVKRYLVTGLTFGSVK